MEIRISGTVMDSIVDGPGLRFTVFTQGCPHRCPGCHNPETHDPLGGRIADTEDLLARMRENPLLSGLTLSGGEPFAQPEACLALALAARALGLDVWVYSGYTYEELLKRGGAARELLTACDVLVDGPFIMDQRSLELSFRGSRNQRLIDLAKTREAGEVRLWAPPVW
ncbi:MAG: anaerobic ribonucleoside-triphosphate reductase activating protein [Eubacteriales bacterium]|nr:anaerobic ribonucleoside-triphosphate reductase activating protein [Eubacteriales bacterium]